MGNHHLSTACTAPIPFRFSIPEYETKLFLLSTVFSRHERGKSSLLEIGIGWLQAQAKMPNDGLLSTPSDHNHTGLVPENEMDPLG
jgi:hypothetical protein